MCCVLCVVVVGFGVGKCSQLFVFACLLCVCVCCVLCCCCVVLLLLCCCCCCCLCVWWVCSRPLRRTLLRRTPLRRTALRRTAQNFALFFPSPATVFILSPSLVGLFCGILGGVFEDRSRRRGSHTTARELQTCTFQGPGASNTTKIPRKRPKEREKRMKNCGGRGKKKREILGPHPSGPPPFGAPQLRGRVILAYMCVRLLVRLYVCHRVGPFWVHFGSILGPFWVHFGSILGPFWVHFGSIVGPLWVHCGSIVGPFWVHCGSIVGPLCVHCVSIVCPLCVHCVSIVCPLCVHCVSIVCPLCVHCVSIVCPLCVHCVSIVCPFWVHFGSILGPFWVHFGSILVHFAYCLNVDAS